MAIKQHYDFRGGYVTNNTNVLMANNELLTAENCYWDKGLRKRNGITLYGSTGISGLEAIRGGIRAYINGVWYTFLAVDNDSEVMFYQGTTTSFSEITNPAVQDFTTGKEVSFAILNEHVVACNGADKPIVIYYSYDNARLEIDKLEAYDVRTRAAANWWAGQYDYDANSGYHFTDDTTDAQDATGTDDDDFDVVAPGIQTSDGFYVACDFTFNKIILKGCEADASAVATYKYWAGATNQWVTVGTPVTSITWSAAEGDKTLEFNIPQDSEGDLAWKVYTPALDTSASGGATVTYDTATGLENKYVLLVQFSTPPSAQFSCDGIEVYHTQYLTEIFEGAFPHLCYTHNNTMLLAERNIINMSPYNTVKGWRSSQVESFQEGGDRITGMASYNNRLAVFKENTIYTWDLNNLLAPVRSRPLSDMGTLAPRSITQVRGYLFYVGADGIYIWDGSQAIKVSKHIQTDIDSYTVKDTWAEANMARTAIGACGVSYNNQYWVSFPQNSIILTADPDTFRTDEAGDARVSFYKYTTANKTICHQFLYINGGGDALATKLYGLVTRVSGSGGPYMVIMDDTSQDQDNIGVASNYAMTIQTKYYNYFAQQLFQLINRIKLIVLGVSSSTQADRQYKLTMLANDGANTSGTITITTDNSASGAGEFYESTHSVPYDCDGYNFSVKLEDNTSGGSPKILGLIGFSVNAERRRF